MTQNALQKKEEANPQVTINVVGDGYARGAPIPWQTKLALKVTLASMPLSYKFLSGLGIFKHGDLAQSLPSLYKGFQEQISYYKSQYNDVPEYCLELGPGDSMGHAILARAHGCKGMWLNDVGDFATKDEAHYRAFYDYIKSQDPEAGALDGKFSNFERDEVLKATNSHYGTHGLSSLKTIPDDKIDFSCSNAVWEHIKRDEFAEHMRELYRMHKSGSISRHFVDLHDHLGGALNNFRFSSKFWESKAVHQAGFYTNRLTMDEMAAYARDAGFEVSIPLINKWKSLPTQKSKMHKAFHNKSEEELNVCTFLIILQKP